MRSAVPALLLVGCIDTAPTSEIASASTVGDYVSGSCSTAVVLGLSRQIADEIGCEHPGGLTSFAATANLSLTSNAVLPYLEADAKADLVAVAHSATVEVNSAFRTIAQQYLLYQWYLQGRCGIAAAATVGHSNHESGRAVDLANWSDVVGAMSNRGWAHDVPGDSVHFDHVASSDIRGEDVHAFQVLWNRNNPGDQIAEDGAYGAHTEARLVAAPATGFATGPSCTTNQHVASVVSIDGPDRVAPQTQATYTVTIANTGTATWPASTTVALDGATSSPLYDASWMSPNVVTALGSDVAPGTQQTIAIVVTTPAETVETSLALPLALVDGATTYDTLSLALVVVPNTTQPTSADGNEAPATATAGCAASGGGAGWLAALALALTAVRRSRRPR